MKKILIALLLPMLLATLSFAQNTKPAYGKKLPNRIKLQEQRSTSLQKSVLKEQLQMTAKDDLRTLRISTDELGMQHEKFQQYYEGIKVEGGTYTVHSNKGMITLMTGDYMNVTDLNTVPSLNPQTAFQAALAHVGAKQYAWEDAVKAGFPDYQKPAGELVVVADPQSRVAARLAYKFDVYAADPLYRAYVFIDAHTGAFIQEHLRIHDTNTPATGTAIYNGNVSFTADYTGSNYRLRQTLSGGGVQTFDLNNGTNYNNATDFTSNSTNFTADEVGVQAHWGAEQVWSYYWNQHGRNSYNNSGGILKSYVHYSNNYVNAFWDGSRMTYGDGDGNNYGPLVSLDICGHEITHGVTEYSANLVYSYEPGALNESFSDIFGESIENYGTGANDWLMGDQIGAGGSGGAIRSMSNPNDYGDPDTYQGTYWYTGSGDNGGVHTNSGVQNKWFYILSVGETGTNDKGDSYSVSGIGMTNAAAIAYRNLTVYLSNNSNYAAARAGAIQSARDLFGVDSPEEIATTDAWYAVGVGNAYGPPPPCVTAAVELTLTLDNYPSETTWNLKNGAGSTIASGGPYSGAGTTINETFNIGTDNYTFSIFDSYGDGICCGYGNGSYSLTSGSTTIVSGGAFGSSEVTEFCVESGGGGGDTEAPTVPGNLSANNTTQSSTVLSWTASTDNIGVDGYNVYVDGVYDGSTGNLSYTVNGLSSNTTYNMEVTAYDAAGNESDPASVNVTTLSGGGGGNVILAHYFETGWQGWQDGGSDCARYSGTRSYEGSYSIRLRDNSGTQSAMTSSSYNVNGYNQLVIDFYFYSYSMENGEDFWVQYYNGSSWSTVAAYAAGTSFTNNAFWHATITLNNVNFPTNAQFRFQCDASNNSDFIYIDAVTVTGSNTLMAGTTTTSSIERIGGPITEAPQGFLSDEETDGLRIFPNPVQNTLQIRSVDPVRSLRVFAADGVQVKDMPGFESSYDLDMSDLTPGLYFIALDTEEGLLYKRIIKQ